MAHPRFSGRSWATVDVVLFTVRPAQSGSTPSGFTQSVSAQSGSTQADAAGRSRRQLQVLLVHRQAEPFAGFWALPGGFLRPDETLEQAANRELLDRTGVSDAYLEQLYSFGDPDRDPRARVVTVTYYGLVAADRAAAVGPAAAAPSAPATARAEWFSLDGVPPLAFDHERILAMAIKRLRNKMDYTLLAFKLLPEEWTRTELRQTYEAILGCDLGTRDPANKRNFEKWVRQMLDRGHIVPVGRERRPAGRGKPAPLYRWDGPLIEGGPPPLPESR